MAALRINDLEEILIEYNRLDGCGDILHGYRFLFNKKNVINPEIINDKFKDGLFIVSDCEFDNCRVISFFEQIIESNSSLQYENIEPPVVHIQCRAWNELKDYRISKWRNAKHPDGTIKYKEGFVESMFEFWEKDVELIFSLDSGFTDNQGSNSNISLHYNTNTDVIRKFVNELKSEFKDFKCNNREQHIQNSM